MNDFFLSVLLLSGIFLAAAFAPAAGAQPVADEAPRFRVLVFSKTAGFRHTSIPNGIAAIGKLAGENGFAVEATEEASIFNLDDLRRFDVIVFLSTTGTILDADQKAALEAFIAHGKGYVGIHAAADTEYDWPWYGALVGGYFKSHPAQQDADLLVEDHDHPSTAHLPDRWRRWDEWYNYRQNPRGSVRVLVSLDEATYKGGEMGDDHPISWAHEVGGGRAWYTGLGHTEASFQEPAFLQHILGGIEWAAGKDAAARD